MKKTPLLNIALSRLVASLGHGDSIVISDAGFPVPMGVATIDLALTRGIPGFMDTLLTMLTEIHVERYVLANELNESNPQLIQQIDLLGLAGKQIVPHEELRHRSRQAHAVIRTGEFTPYANIILVAGVVF